MFVTVFRICGGSIVGRSSGLKGEMCRRLRSVIGLVYLGEQKLWNGPKQYKVLRSPIPL